MVLGFLMTLAIMTVSVSLSILFRGRVYRWLKPESRPRRGVLLSLLLLFVVFAMCPGVDQLAPIANR